MFKQSSDGDIIDCVHISNQPAFDHPFLKDHKIQVCFSQLLRLLELFLHLPVSKFFTTCRCIRRDLLSTQKGYLMRTRCLKNLKKEQTPSISCGMKMEGAQKTQFLLGEPRKMMF